MIPNKIQTEFQFKCTVQTSRSIETAKNASPSIAGVRHYGKHANDLQ